MYPKDTSVTRIEIRPCLYCDQLGRSQEHVLQQMFGKYENNLTTWDVCLDCNNVHFGEKLELAFGRNSMEAIFRLIFGVKSPDEAHEIGGDRVAATYLEDDEFRGARLVWASDGAGGFQAEMPPQVIISHASADVPRALLEDEITSDAVRPFLNGGTVLIPGDPDDEKVQRVIAKMMAASFVFVGDVESVRVPPRASRDFLLRIDAIVDDAIARVVAKMAVNFLAATVGYDFAMRPEFRPMRKYARYGEPFLRHRVHPVARSIELDGTRDRCGDGHVMTLDWSFATGEVIALISLFNRITYQVDLADDVQAVWRDIGVAYHFDPTTRQVKRLHTGAGEHMTLVPETMKSLS